MSTGVPHRPKLYHIVHVDRLASVVESGRLFCDAEVTRRELGGTAIGMSTIKQRRLQRALSSQPDLHVGECVPFYFCPRSVMLYLISRANYEELGYRGGQEPIVHLEADLHRVVEWADRKRRQWAFTTSNAGSSYFGDYRDLGQLGKIDWRAVAARNWQQCMEGKQAEFLVERSFPWKLVERIGVYSQDIGRKALQALSGGSHRPVVEVLPDWYY